MIDKLMIDEQVHYWTDGAIGKLAMRQPMVLGHESAGTVVAVGSQVKSITPGDDVALEPGIPCRRCERCKSGRYNQCPEMRFAATPPVDGTLAKYYVLPEDFCYKLPKPEATSTSEKGPNKGQHGVTLEEGALVEPLSVAVHLIKRADVKHGDSVIVFGAGPIGLLSCAVARAFGATTIVAVDVSAERLAFATDYAATHSFNPSSSNNEKNGDSNDRGRDKEDDREGDNDDDDDARTARNLLHACTIDEIGADKAIDASGAASCIRVAIQSLRVGGTFVQGGMGSPNIKFPIAEVCQKELDVKGSFRYAAGDYRLAVDLVATGKVDVKKLISGKVKFQEAEEAFRRVRDRTAGIKILIEGPE